MICDVVSVNYCISLSKKEMLTVLSKDEEVTDHTHSLSELLSKISGVSKVDYDGLYGAFVFVTVNREDDSKKTWLKIVGVISDYCYD
jgi:hypothetical protein